jgi:hypothetical protein
MMMWVEDIPWGLGGLLGFGETDDGNFLMIKRILGGGTGCYKELTAQH